MEKNIVLIHAGLGVLFLLYLLIRLFISLFGLSDKEYQNTIRAKFRIPDWVFIVLITITGLYPIVLIGQFELYHILKTLSLALLIWLSRYKKSLNFAAASLMAIVLTIFAAFTSFSDKPTFPRKASTFEKDHPEIAQLPLIEKGRTIFTTLCVQCHGSDGTMGRFGAADLSQSKLDLEEKIEMITNGSPLTVMRSFKDQLSEDEIVAVATYIEALK